MMSRYVLQFAIQYITMRKSIENEQRDTYNIINIVLCQHARPFDNKKIFLKYLPNQQTMFLKMFLKNI